MMVYSPWTPEDVKKATEGIQHPKVNIAQFRDGIMGKIDSYHLNGREIEQVIRQVLGPDWHHVVGDWSGLNAQGEVLPQNGAELKNRRNALMERIEERWIKPHPQDEGTFQ